MVTDRFITAAENDFETKDVAYLRMQETAEQLGEKGCEIVEMPAHMICAKYTDDDFYVMWISDHAKQR